MSQGREVGGRGWRAEREVEVVVVVVRLPAPPRPKGMVRGWEGVGSWRVKEGAGEADIVVVLLWWWW